MSELPLTQPSSGGREPHAQSGASYQPPLAQLLTLGEPEFGRAVSYGELGLGPAEVPELIRMVADESLHNAPGDTPQVWAPVHAWRALGELRAEAAISALLGLLPRLDKNADDWLASELPKVFGTIGPATISPLAAFLADTGQGEYARIAAVEALAKVAGFHPELRPQILRHVTTQFEKFAEQTPELNAFLICAFLDLHAVEALPLMEQAFAADLVAQFVTGDFEDVQIELGVKTQREGPRALNSILPAGSSPFMEDLLKAEFEPAPPVVNLPYVAPPKIGRNDPCPCGSGKKYKKCCGQ